MSDPFSILIVEDDPAVGRSLQDGLKREGYRVIWKTLGEEAIERAVDQPPDLIILDVRLPDISGFDVCQRLRKLKMRQPILMLTVRGEEMDKVLGLEMGADDYVTKPYSLRELLSRIRALLRRSYGDLSGTDADLLYVEDLVIDRTRGQVHLGDQLLSLSPTEFRLLVYLARNRGQALSRAQILDGVWGYDAEVENEATVNVNIRRLREKIEHDPSRPALILTVPGIGYRLADKP
ncbi:MAG: response regulator transcription factor [Anaerolineaceae bacterium]|nr:MAG: response regulator transcription factor [Anaerolineaceae bacterium]